MWQHLVKCQIPHCKIPTLAWTTTAFPPPLKYLMPDTDVSSGSFQVCTLKEKILIQIINWRPCSEFIVSISDVQSIHFISFSEQTVEMCLAVTKKQSVSFWPLLSCCLSRSLSAYSNGKHGRLFCFTKCCAAVGRHSLTALFAYLLSTWLTIKWLFSC